MSSSENAAKRPPAKRTMTPAEPDAPQTSDVVLDASALGALVFDEPGGEQVLARLTSAAISAVNLSEIVAKAIHRGKAGDAVRAALAGLPLRVLPFDAQQAYSAAALYPAVRHAGLSFADRACLALGTTLQLPVMTADRVWGQLSLPVDVLVIR